MAKEKSKKDERILDQTKGTFRALGVVTGVERDNYYKSGIIEKGKMADKEYRSLKFGVKTSPQQTSYVEMFGIDPDAVYVWQGRNKGTEKVDYDTFLDKMDSWAEEGKITLDSAVNLDSTDKNAPRSHMPKFDNIDLIYDKLENGMTVYVSGNISRNRYENRNTGEMVTQTRYEMQNISLAEDIDFDDPKFREWAVFTEEFILVDTILDKEEEKLILSAKTVDYNENVYDVQYDVSYARSMNGEPESLEGMTDEEKEKNEKYVDEQVEQKQRMIKAFRKLKYGSYLKCDGKIINKVIVTETEEEDDVNPLLAELRGNSKKVVRDYVKSTVITGTSELKEGKYTEDDFIKALEKNELVEKEAEKAKKDDNPLGDLSGTKEEDPFGSSIDIDTEDLPF